MSTIILLDTGLLGLITYPKASLEGDQCRQWLASLSQRESKARVPEIADYELRRELLRMDKFKDIQYLDNLKVTLGYIPLTTPAMLLAAQLWAQARKQGKPTLPHCSEPSRQGKFAETRPTVGVGALKR
jgi:hypothetical protein